MNDRGHGWVIFASIVLGVAGIMRIFDAIWAFRYHGAVPQNLEDAIFGTSLKTYGWVYLIVGIILILSSLAVMGHSQLGRWVGIAAGAIGAISAIWWMPYYPIWSLTYIALGVFVIYALAAYGGPVEATLSPAGAQPPLTLKRNYSEAHLDPIGALLCPSTLSWCTQACMAIQPMHWLTTS